MSNTKKYEEFVSAPFTYNSYQESSKVKNAYDALQNQVNNAPGAYQSQWQDQIKDIMSQITNREDFSYDVNSDALYQQYAEQYVRQGKMASADVMGQAAAMTGGYGNSYATSAGNQAYQAYLQELNAVVPELYQMAYDRYKQEGQDLLTQYAMLGEQENLDYGRYRDTVSDYYTERDYLTNRYDSERNFDYSKYVDNRDFAYGDYSDRKAYAYQDHQAQTAYEQWLEELALSERQVALQEQQYQLQEQQYKDSKSKTENTGNNGNTGGTIDTSAVPSNVRDKVASFESNTSLANYLDGLEASGVISPAQSDALYAEYMDDNEKYIKNTDGSIKAPHYADMLQSTKGWSVVDDGGVNWFGLGIDADAIVKAPNGETIRLDNLRSKLKSEGMSTSQANQLIKSLMKNLGI